MCLITMYAKQLEVAIYKKEGAIYKKEAAEYARLDIA